MDATMDDNKILTLLLLMNNNHEAISSTSESNDNESEDEDVLILNSELEILYPILIIGETRGEMVFANKLTDYVERVIPGYSRIIFKEHFRMFPETFEIVLGTIGPGLRAINDAAGTRIISEEKQLLIVIWFMATPDSYRSVATKFGVGKATAF